MSSVSFINVDNRFSFHFEIYFIDLLRRICLRPLDAAEDDDGGGDGDGDGDGDADGDGDGDGHEGFDFQFPSQ
uniref:Uncharacterized protein n=1 Tax=Glossina austeni TaxID=7395 RepID=A0A1A9UUD4_GLOAU